MTSERKAWIFRVTEMVPVGATVTVDWDNMTLTPSAGAIHPGRAVSEPATEPDDDLCPHCGATRGVCPEAHR